MLSIPVGIRITGAKDAQGRVQRLSPSAKELIRKASEARATRMQTRFQTEMAREYTSPFATGQLARGITFKVAKAGDGVDVQFFINDRRELRYVTALLGGHFQRFPVGPFVIRATNPTGTLRIPLVGQARQFVRGAKGRFRGSRGSALFVKSVLWGRKSGGFSRDVISEVAEQEGALFVQDVQDAVGIAIERTTG